ncbi:hypothetical protein D516_2955 [Rhodobacter sp. AKP1]|nr:hypothetical protein D516_2955 [Rhodobacter sp. AKP1]
MRRRAAASTCRRRAFDDARESGLPDRDPAAARLRWIPG